MKLRITIFRWKLGYRQTGAYGRWACMDGRAGMAFIEHFLAGFFVNISLLPSRCNNAYPMDLFMGGEEGLHMVTLNCGSSFGILPKDMFTVNSCSLANRLHIHINKKTNKLKIWGETSAFCNYSKGSQQLKIWYYRNR